MGNKLSGSERSGGEKEMENPKKYYSEKPGNHDLLLDLDQLSDLSQRLDELMQKVSQVIADVIFHTGGRDMEQASEIAREDDDVNPIGEAIATTADSEGMDTKLYGMTRCIQHLIHDLTWQLEDHARTVGSHNNAKLMALVKSVVNSVNNYMAMLMRNIRKLRRLSVEGAEVKRQEKEYQFYDVIQDSQDIDDMLMQLSSTGKERERLETDVIDVLIIYKDFKLLQDKMGGMDDAIEREVRLAAESMIVYDLNKKVKK